jgi:hypothetical protein
MKSMQKMLFQKLDIFPLVVVFRAKETSTIEGVKPYQK